MLPRVVRYEEYHCTWEEKRFNFLDEIKYYYTICAKFSQKTVSYLASKIANKKKSSGQIKRVFWYLISLYGAGFRISFVGRCATLRHAAWYVTLKIINKSQANYHSPSSDLLRCMASIHKCKWLLNSWQSIDRRKNRCEWYLLIRALTKEHLGHKIRN